MLVPARPTSRVTAILDTLEKVFKIFAYIVGAGWVYFNFFKGRTYHPRLETRVSGELCRRVEPEFVRIVLQVKNVGLSKVDIHQKGTALRLLVLDQSAKDSWRHIATLSILMRHQWIEPGELLEEHVLHPQQLSNIAALKAELIVVGKKTMWEASTIIT